MPVEQGSIMGLIGAFVGIAILLGISTTILGNSVSDCSLLSDYDESAATQTGWAGQCVANNEATQNAFSLLVIVLIVVAAVVILTVVKLL
ncbi:MAG: hypothetical protein ACW9WZ_06750 [Nitrosopumilus sp.]|jgi:uncharacterized membrane protein YeaQ/YmgE (transglycosylase-associated protein family)